MKNKGLRIVAMLLMVAMFLPTIVACSKGDKDGDANTGVNANNGISESTDSEDSTGNQSTTFTVIFEDFDGTVLKKIEGVEKGISYTHLKTQPEKAIILLVGIKILKI